MAAACYKNLAITTARTTQSIKLIRVVLFDKNIIYTNHCYDSYTNDLISYSL